MKILCYVEGGDEVGLGHMRRSEALAYALREKGGECDFINTSDDASGWLALNGWKIIEKADADASHYDAVLIDSYIAPPETVERFTQSGKPLVGFHDFGEPDAQFSLIISSVHEELTTIGATRVLGGFDYKIIHPDILQAQKIAVREKVKKAVLTLGGAPSMISHLERLAEVLEESDPGLDVDPLYGLTGAQMARAFAAADLAVTGGGQTMFELAYLGVPMVGILISEDQAAQLSIAKEKGMLESVLPLDDKDISAKIVESVRSLYSQPKRAALSQASKAAIDGRGAERIAGEIQKLI